MGGCSINPLTWGTCLKDAADSAQQAIQNIVVGVLQLFLSGLLSVFQTVASFLQTLLVGTIQEFAAVAIAMGPFGAPFFVVFLIALAAALMIAWQVLKDAPGVDAFA